MKSSVAAFGGSIGGVTSQTRLEEAELAALASEKSRLQIEVRQSRRRSRHRSGSPMLEDMASAVDVQESFAAEKIGGSPANSEGLAVSMEDIENSRRTNSGSDSDGEEPRSRHGDCSQEVSREMLIEATARAQLRTKFDHVGIDPHSSVLNSHDVRAIAESRGMTNSPPPPSLGIAAAPGIALTGGHSGLLRLHPNSPTSPDKSLSPLARAPSPILFNSSVNGHEGSSSPTLPLMHANPASIHLLQLHHAVAMANASPFDLIHSSSVGGRSSTAVPSNQGLASRDMDVESRSSASSDLDSESDDVSFDDSASDRSDGSDSGQYNEPLTAARAMALNRLQQQQRRVLTSLQHQHGERPPSDSEYQSGDSIDSTRAEDSGGSDSSSSDIAD